MAGSSVEATAATAARAAARAAARDLLPRAARTTVAVLPPAGNVIVVRVGQSGAPSLAAVVEVDGAKVVSPPVVFEGEHAVGVGVWPAHRHTASRGSQPRAAGTH